MAGVNVFDFSKHFLHVYVFLRTTSNPFFTGKCFFRLEEDKPVQNRPPFQNRISLCSPSVELNKNHVRQTDVSSGLDKTCEVLGFGSCDGLPLPTNTQET